MRLLRHLFALPGAVARAFPANSMSRIEQAIKEGERSHDGEIRFAVEAALHPAQVWRGVSARSRAIELFAERDVEIVADRGFNGKVSAEEWERVCRRMEGALRERRHADAVIDGVHAVSSIIARHFPPQAGGRNELPDAPASV